VEREIHGGDRFTHEELSERTRLSLRTLAKVLDGRSGVDRQSLEAVFAAFDLELQRSDYHRPGAGDPEADGAAVVTLDRGEAPDVSSFHGRERELATLTGWLEGEPRCRLIAVLGMGGVGKTSLVTKLLERLAARDAAGDAPYEVLLWRSLRQAPDPVAFTARLVSQLAPREAPPADPFPRLLELIRERRCLLVLDNFETVLLGHPAGRYRPGCEGYGELLRLFAGGGHRSSLILTSREQPLEPLAFGEGESTARLLPLAGCPVACLALLESCGLVGREEQRLQLAERCGHSPLAVQLIAAAVRDLFDGDIAAFLAEETTLLGGLRPLLDQQFERLSVEEETLMLWLALRREWSGIGDLAEGLVPPLPRTRVLAAIEGLARRSLIERQGSRFGLQPVVLEYAGERLVERIAAALAGEGPLVPLHRFPVLLATAPDPIRASQRRLILEPVGLHLQARLGSTRAVVERLRGVLAALPRTPGDLGPGEGDGPDPSYAAGSVVNLLHHLGADLAGIDLAGLAVWQADLPGVPLPRANLSGADLRHSVLTSTFSAVFGLACHPDGERFATTEIGGVVRFWRLADGQPIRAIAASRQWIWGLAFSPDGRLMATAGGERSIGLWDVEGDGTTPLRRLEGHNDQIHAVAFDAGGEHLASAGGDGSVRLWSAATGECLHVLRGHEGAVLAVAFHPSRDWLISGGADGTLRIWEAASGRPVGLRRGHSDQVRALAIHPDGARLASGGDGIRLWSLEEDEPPVELGGHGAHVLSLQFDPSGRILASSGTDCSIRLWDAVDGRLLRMLSGSGNWTRSLCWSPDGRTLLSGCSDYAVRLWETESGQLLRTWAGWSNWMWQAGFSGDGRRIVSAGGDRMVRLWDAGSGALQRTLPGHSTWVIAACFDPGDRWIASAGDQEVHLWDAGSGRLLRTLRGHDAHVHALRFSPRGDLLASGAIDYTVRLWNPADGRCLAVLEGHRDWIRTLDIRGDGTVLVSGGHDHTVKLWETATGRCLSTLEAGDAWVMAVAFHPDGERLISASDLDLRLWDWQRGEVLCRLKGHTSRIRSVAVSPDGHRLVAGSSDGRIHLWDLRAGRWRLCCEGHQDQVLSVQFAPDGATLVSGSADETLKLWDPATGRCLRTLQAEGLYAGMRIDGVSGLSSGTIATLRALGAVECA
jgi:WD40 repeat protein